MFNAVIEDINLNILFLKNVMKITLATIDKNGTLSIVKSVTKSIENIDMVGTDGFVMNKVTVQESESGSSSPSFYKLSIDFDKNENLLSEDAKQLGEELRVKPSIAVSGFIPTNDGQTIPSKFSGRVSVLLPLPDTPGNKTDFPCLVNANFALSDDRRSVKFMDKENLSMEVSCSSINFDSIVFLSISNHKLLFPYLSKKSTDFLLIFR